MISAVVMALASPSFAAINNASPQPQKVGYSFGYILGKSNIDALKGLDSEAFIQGIRDGFSAKAGMLTDEQIKTILLQYKQSQDAAEMQAFTQQGKTNATQGSQFLAQNAKKEGIKTTKTGLQYQVIYEGRGKKPSAASRVTVNYEGKLLDGTVFDSSIARNEPATFALNQVIAGWTEGLQLMKEGSKYRFFIPANLAYGETGAGKSIGPNSTLIFDIELIKVE